MVGLGGTLDDRGGLLDWPALQIWLTSSPAPGNGPVDALNGALRKALLEVYPALADMHLTDYRVRILDGRSGTAAKTRVMIESEDATGRTWTTVGVSTNIIDASFDALLDAIAWKLLKEGAHAI